MKFALSVVVMGIVHFIATYLLVFAAGVGSRNPLVVIGAKVLSFPLSLIPGSGDGSNDNQALGWILMVAQSLGWGFVICYLFRMITAANRGA